VKDLISAGVHFGHRTSRWNPKMKQFIFGKRNLIHIVDIRETVKGLLRARKLLAHVVSSGQDVLFVATKRQARESVRTETERCGMHYVTERWLGGTLTNFRTIRSRLQRLEELESIVGGPNWDQNYSKKMQSTLQRELRKIKRNLEGIRRMSRLPGAIVVIDVQKEHNALREARMLDIPTVCLIDTDGDPDMASIPIPGNDDSIRSIALIMKHLADAVEEGKKSRPEKPAKDEESEGSQRRRGGGGRRGGSRSEITPSETGRESAARAAAAPTPAADTSTAVAEASDDSTPAESPAAAEASADTGPETPES
jgi:small subunit ribosomal protein S2